MLEKPEITPKLRQILNEIAAFGLNVARPLYWHDGAPHQKLEGGSCFILQFGDRYIGVTANHVLQAYLDAKAENTRLTCQLFEGRIELDKSIIAQSVPLDLATFAISPVLLPTYKANVLNCTSNWPPPNVEVGEIMSAIGYPEVLRIPRGLGHFEFGAWGASCVADSVTEREIVTAYDPTQVLSPPWAQMLPPLGVNLSGCSGGPLILHKVVNGLQRFFPVGVIIRGPTGRAHPEADASDRSALGELGAFDRFHFRRLHFMNEDGTFAEQDTGWLPG